MYYKISDHIALRSWKRTPRAFYIKNYAYAKRLTPEEFFVMLLSDGEHDLTPDKTLESLEKRRLITACEKGDHPSDWSSYKQYDNIYMPKMNLMITGKCNYNCLHCFNAADNAPLMTEWSFEDLCGLLDEAHECGIHGLTLTGGEPMLHPRFMDIVEAIVKRDMFVEELNTNGYFITEEVLDRMKSLGCIPLVKISFDGIGCHDWMRARKGAEERTLAAIRLCTEKGFPVKVQTQVNRKTLPSLLPTMDIMEELGVREVRLIRTTEVERWAMNAGDATLSLTDYYDEMLAFAKEYAAGDHRMDIDIWQFLKLYPKNKVYDVVPVMRGENAYRGSAPVCMGNRGLVGVTSEGDAVPCLQMSGYYKDHGIFLGNLHQTSLKELLAGGPYLERICATVDDLKNANPKCASCRWFKYCCGGCRALGHLHSGDRQDPLGSDLSKCLFFEGGWYEKVTGAFSEWTDLKPISIMKSPQSL